jgi:uncharacterized metal-binding protein
MNHAARLILNAKAPVEMKEAKDDNQLYDNEDLNTMRVAEGSRLPGKNRVQELVNFARNSGYRKIGIANCIGLQKETEKLKAILSEEFEVHSVDCKHGKLNAGELLGNDARGVSCNPAGQAAELDGHQTELNISFGLCMGHDVVFNKKSRAPVTTLVVKDREHRHNPFRTFEE